VLSDGAARLLRDAAYGTIAEVDSTDGRFPVTRRGPGGWLLGGPALVCYLAAAKLLLHFMTNGQYGYHGDEFYFMACGDRLDFGYVDHAPFIALVAKVSRLLLGDSLFALRFFPALAGALTVVLTGLIVREFGGGRFAQCLAALAVIISPAYLRIGNMLCIPAFELPYWTLASYIVVVILKRDRPKLWLVVGLVCGAGLLNKHSMLLWGFGIVAGVLLTPARRHLASKWLWLGGLVALVLFLPNLIWQIQHDWVTLEFLRNLNEHVMKRISVVEFGFGQIIYVHPANLPIWLLGLGCFLLSKGLRPYRLLGWSYVALFVLLNVIKSKIYYLSPAYPLLLAGGAYAIGEFLCRRRWRLARPALVAFLVAGGGVFAPLGLPLLPLKQCERYARTITGGVLDNIYEVIELYYAMYGWENQVATVARVYEKLPPEDRSRCTIWAGNYSEAGAIDFFGRRYGLPRAISGHTSYHMWGPGDATGEVVIAFGVWHPSLEEFYAEVTQVEVVRSELSVTWETDLPVYVCRKPKMPIDQFWPRVGHF
jgi:hypothetical protein